MNAFVPAPALPAWWLDEALAWEGEAPDAAPCR